MFNKYMLIGENKDMTKIFQTPVKYISYAIE